MAYRPQARPISGRAGTQRAFVHGGSSIPPGAVSIVSGGNQLNGTYTPAENFAEIDHRQLRKGMMVEGRVRFDALPYVAGKIARITSRGLIELVGHKHPISPFMLYRVHAVAGAPPIASWVIVKIGRVKAKVTHNFDKERRSKLELLDGRPFKLNGEEWVPWNELIPAPPQR